MTAFAVNDKVHILSRPAAFPYIDVRRAFVSAGMMGIVKHVAETGMLPILVATPQGEHMEYFEADELELVEDAQ